MPARLFPLFSPGARRSDLNRFVGWRASARASKGPSAHHAPGRAAGNALCGESGAGGSERSSAVGCVHRSHRMRRRAAAVLRRGLNKGQGAARPFLPPHPQQCPMFFAPHPSLPPLRFPTSALVPLLRRPASGFLPHFLLFAFDPLFCRSVPRLPPQPFPFLLPPRFPPLLPLPSFPPPTASSARGGVAATVAASPRDKRT